MALYIKHEKGWLEWHTGEPIPPIPSRVVTFQADGDELEMILSAMKPTTIGNVNMSANIALTPETVEEQLPMPVERIEA